MEKLLEIYADIFAVDPKNPGITINQTFYRTSVKENEVIQKEVEEMLKNNIIQPSSSSWASPVVLVKKKDGKMRFCVDYRKLNEVTEKDVYPLPRIDDTLDTLSGAKYFSVADEDQPKTAFKTKQGLFEFKVMPFGLCNAPATFQRTMDRLLVGLKWSICLVYLDDIVIFSKNFEDHLKDLKQVFDRIRIAKLHLKAEKCSFCRTEINYLIQRNAKLFKRFLFQKM